MVFGIIIGVAIGYLFKPQLSTIIKKIITAARRNMRTEE